MAGNRNRPSMGMNFHEEHLRNLNYGVTGMKIGTTTASTLGPDLVEETRNTETASLRFSKSAGSGYSAHRRASSPYRDEDMHYSDVGYINSGHTGRVDASAQSNGRHASGNYRRAARGTTDPGGAYRRHASDQMSNRYHNMQFDNTEILTRWRKEIAEMMMNNVITMYLLDSIEELPIPRDLIFMHQNLIDIQGQAACARQAFQPHRLAIYQAVLIKKRRHKYNTIP